MAPFSNCISFIFLTTLLLSLQINARDSQFFSKVTHDNINNNNVKEAQFPNNEGAVNKPEQQPVFLPETDNSYGLYGHESGQNPPTTTTNADPYAAATTYQPHKTESVEATSKYPTNNYYSYNKDAYNSNQNEMSNTRLAGTAYGTNNNNYYYSKDAYGGRQNQESDTRYTEGGYNSLAKQNNNQKYYYNYNAASDRHYYSNNNAANDRFSYTDNVANERYNGERQGISDTRFMEGGKYFYDVNSEKYNPTLSGDSSRGVNSGNWHDKRGYFGNNNANSYENKNSLEGYQNQEFEAEQEDSEP